VLRPAGKYITEAPDPIVKFRKYRAFDNGSVREFYSLLRLAMLGARRVTSTVSSMIKHCQASWRGCLWATGNSGLKSGLRGLAAHAFWAFID
jgi:hypothetical protein